MEVSGTAEINYLDVAHYFWQYGVMSEFDLHIPKHKYLLRVDRILYGCKIMLSMVLCKILFYV